VDRFGGVSEDLDPADHFPRPVADRSDAHLHRYPLAVLALGIHEQRAFAAGSGHHGSMQRAVFLAAQRMAVLVNVAQEVVEALASDDLRGGPPVIRAAESLQ